MDATCDWNNPGFNPYRGTIAAAVARYDMPQEARDIIAYKAGKLAFDDLVDISRDGMKSRTTEYTGLKNMHFGRSVCKGNVSVAKWAADHVERAFVFCASEKYCIAVPFICRNVSQITPVIPPVVSVPQLPEYPFNFPFPPEPTPIPEPASVMLVLAGLGLLAATRKNHDKR